VRAVYFATLSLLILFASPTAALDPFHSLGGYGRMSWGEENGLTSGIIRALAQDAEGYLWIGTDGGLLRFDGTEFVSWPPYGPTDSNSAGDTGIRALLVARDGSLWVGGTSGLTRLKNGVRVSHADSGDLPSGSILTLAEDGRGTVWAGGPRGAMRLIDGHWLRFDASLGLPDAPVILIYMDVRGCAWLSTPLGVYRLDPSTPRFVQVTDFLANSLNVSPDGDVWMSDPKNGLRRLKPNTMTVPALQGEQRTRMVRDRDGNLWVGTASHGLWRLTVDGRRYAFVQQLSSVEALHTYGVQALLEDRDGNLWIAAGTRLLRLSDVDVRMISESDGLPAGGIAAVAVTNDRTTWAATPRGLYSIRRIDSGAIIVRQEMSRAVSALHVDALNRLWLATVSPDLGKFEVGTFIEGRFAPLPLPSDALVSPVAAIAIDSDGGVWMCDAIVGLKRWHKNRLEPFKTLGALQTSRCNSAEVDETGAAWFGFSTGGAAVFVRGAFRTFDPTRMAGVTAPEPTTVHAGLNKTVWATMPGTLARFKDDRWKTVFRWSQPRGATVSTIEDMSGHVWTGVGASLIRAPSRSEVGTATDLRWFDESNGLAGLLGAKPLGIGWPSAARSSDGRLWFATSQGVALIDPARLGPRGTLGAAKVDSVIADGRALPLAASLQIPAGTTKLEIHYAALNLSAPRWVRFRYQLEGVDADWVDAGARRQAFYTNLSPRTYRFRIAASDREGSWPESQSSIVLKVQPAFQQTAWFYIAIVCAGLSVVATAWWLRLRALRHRFALVLSERTRVAREIHDTLLQSVGGAALELEALISEFDGAPQRSVEALRDLRRRMTSCIREARDSIEHLRSQVNERETLETSLKRLAKTVLPRDCVWTVNVIGEQQACAPVVAEQLLRVAQEAMTNAVRHGRAKSVAIELEYHEDSVRLSVADDGSGFDLQDPISALPGHWGIATMRERMGIVGGSFKLTSLPGQGTCLETVVPLQAEWKWT
jgi:signal transduction histidine kinase/streptogramin lyase